MGYHNSLMGPPPPLPLSSDALLYIRNIQVFRLNIIHTSIGNVKDPLKLIEKCFLVSDCNLEQFRSIEMKNRVWHKKFFFPRLLKLLSFPNQYCCYCIFILLYFRKYQELRLFLLKFFFSRLMFPFFLFHFFSTVRSAAFHAKGCC